MTGTDPVDQLLAGPRGRRLCLALLAGDPPSLSPGALRAAVAATDLQAIAGTAEPPAFLDALLMSVITAMYWQPPDGEDQALADPRLAELLRPVAEAVLRSPASGWWSRPVEVSDQTHVEQVFRHHPDDPPQPPETSPLPADGAAAALRRWRDETVAWEQTAAAAWRDRRETGSGEWWSTPGWSAAVRSTPAVPTTALPVGMVLIEESAGDADVIRTRSLRVRPDARVYEISGSHAWQEFVAAYPLSVTSSRRQDWREATGHNGPWAMPDWAAVAETWDGVHLTVTGYLTTAGRPLPVASGAHTLLAGWSPDLTCWLTDVIESVGEATTWRWADGDDLLGWRPDVTGA